jgi:pyridoxine 5-phosphate synthase
MPLLGVNIDHIASVRQLRKGTTPDPLEAARACVKAGADSIVVHLREDRRHINDADLKKLRSGIRTKLNLEMSIDPQIVRVALRVKPDQATLVPERRQELTTEGGLDVIGQALRVRRTIRRLEAGGIPASIFIDPDIKQIARAREIGAQRIELHTGAFALADNAASRAKELRTLRAAAVYARTIGFEVFAGHGLDYDNVKQIKRIKEIKEYNIGYSIICRALFTGLETAVRQMKRSIG